MTDIERLRWLDHYVPVPESGCWIWLGGWDRKGYGQVSNVAGKRMVRSHRYFYEAHVGPIGKGLFVCHKCDTRACVNPAHLFLGTNADNVADCKAKGRLADTSGRKNGAAKITEKQEFQIRFLLTQGFSQARISRALGMNHMTVSRAARRFAKESVNANG